METSPTPPEGCIRTERRGAVLLIGIDRPAKRNGFTPRMFRERRDRRRPGAACGRGHARRNALKAVEQGPLAAMAEFVEVQQALAHSDDAAEGVRSFVGKRPARFQGR